MSQLMSLGRTILRGVTGLIYPNLCWTCGVLMPTDDKPVCDACFPQLAVDPYLTCPRCSSTIGPYLILDGGCPDCREESFAFDGAFRMAPYSGLLREVVLRMKHWTGEDLAEAIGSMWAQQMANRLRPLRPDVVVPVPLHWMRRWQRGFNLCDILASHLGRTLDIPVWPRALRRVRATAQQSMQSSAAARKENVKKAFHARTSHSLSGKTVLLIDDVLTTGATASEAARALRSLKPKEIYVVVLAHGR